MVLNITFNTSVELEEMPEFLKNKHYPLKETRPQDVFIVNQGKGILAFLVPKESYHNTHLTELKSKFVEIWNNPSTSNFHEQILVINNIEWCNISFTLGKDNKSQAYNLFCTINNGLLYMISLSCLSNNWKILEKGFSEVISSVKFLN